MKTSFSRKATCIQILCFLTTSCINLEWRGGMTPHFGLSESENNQTSVYPERVPFLRPISQSWSQFRGPSRNGLIPPQRFSLDFSKPPALRWVKNCGPGHSSIVTEGELVITLEQNNQYETLSARSLDNGDEVWQRVEKTSWNDYFSGEGPRSTPTIADGKILLFFKRNTFLCECKRWEFPLEHTDRWKRI